MSQVYEFVMDLSPLHELILGKIYSLKHQSTYQPIEKREVVFSHCFQVVVGYISHKAFYYFKYFTFKVVSLQLKEICLFKGCHTMKQGIDVMNQNRGTQ